MYFYNDDEQNSYKSGSADENECRWRTDVYIRHENLYICTKCKYNYDVKEKKKRRKVDKMRVRGYEGVDWHVYPQCGLQYQFEKWKKKKRKEDNYWWNNSTIGVSAIDDGEIQSPKD